MAISDKEERFILAKAIITKMRRCTEINGLLDHYKEHGTLGYPKQMAMVNTDDVSFKQLTFIIKNYPTYKARKLRKANAQTDKDKKAVLMAEYELMSKQLDDAREKIKTL